MNDHDLVLAAADGGETLAIVTITPMGSPDLEDDRDVAAEARDAVADAFDEDEVVVVDE
jgi:hypothetical protein